jgi:CheY-like chemotaxis protein
MKRIRSQIKFKRLPVIALTAKAMKDDKQNVYRRWSKRLHYKTNRCRPTFIINACLVK